MDLSERFPVTPGKVEALVARLRALGVDPRLIEESFTKGGGPGGQKINKTSNRVNLAYPPLEVRVRCQDSRSRSLNRFLSCPRSSRIAVEAGNTRSVGGHP